LPKADVLKPTAPFSKHMDPDAHWRNSYIATLQGVFNAFDYGSHLPHWDEDPEQTEIVITGDAPVSYEVVSQKPHIIVLLGGFGYVGVAMDQLEEQTIAGATRKHADLIQGAMTINVLARFSDEARRFATLCMRSISYFRRHLQTAGGFHHIDSRLSCSQPLPPEGLVSGTGEQELTLVSVASPFYVADSWIAEEGGKAILESVAVRLSAVMYPLYDVNKVSKARQLFFSGRSVVYNPPQHDPIEIP